MHEKKLESYILGREEEEAAIELRVIEGARDAMPPCGEDVIVGVDVVAAVGVAPVGVVAVADAGPVGVVVVVLLTFDGLRARGFSKSSIMPYSSDPFDSTE